MTNFTPRKIVRKFEVKLLDTNLRLENVIRQRSAEFFDTLIWWKSLGLNFILIGFLVKRKAVSGDWSVDCWAEVSIVLDNVSLFTLDLDVFTGLVHLSENLDSLSLDLGESSFLVLSFLKSDLFSSLGMSLFSFFFSFNEGWLQQVEALVLQSSDVLLSLIPFSYLLFFHKFSSKGETSLIWGWWQSVFKSSLLAHLLNKFHFGHTCGQAFSKSEIGNTKNFRHIFLIYDVFRRIRISLCLRLSEYGLHLSRFSLWFFHSDFCRFNSILLDLHNTKIISKRSVFLRWKYLHFRWYGLNHWDNWSLEILMSILSTNIWLKLAF